MPETYTAEDFATALENYRSYADVPKGETDILMDALRIAERVYRPGFIRQAWATSGLKSGPNAIEVAIRKALTDV